MLAHKHILSHCSGAVFTMPHPDAPAFAGLASGTARVHTVAVKVPVSVLSAHHGPEVRRHGVLC